jgi:hypothetical protein
LISLLGIPVFGQARVIARKIKQLLQGLYYAGLYEVLEYKSVLELKDKTGGNAYFRKQEKIRFLQNGIIAYQDQAWGDGDILINYRCYPGKPVDRYRPGSKTYILISLREIKNKGDEIEIKTEWGIRGGFLRTNELWETEISHRTKKLKIQIIFPKTRPPTRVLLFESMHRRTRSLGQDAMTQQPDGRWLISWETHKPRLHERYILQWKW